MVNCEALPASCIDFDGEGAPERQAFKWRGDVEFGHPGSIEILAAFGELPPEVKGLIRDARARSWMNDLSEGRVNSFEEIARRENKVERHIRRLVPLASVAPRIVEAVTDGSAPADLTVTWLTNALPHCWTEQEKKFGVV